MADAIRRAADEYEDNKKSVGFLVSEETAAALQDRKNVFAYGKRNDMHRIAAEIYEGLRWFDDKDIDVILGEGTSSEGLGLAIMNRLHKASGFNSVFI